MISKNTLKIIIILFLLYILMKSNKKNKEFFSHPFERSYQNDLAFSKSFCNTDCKAPYMSAWDDDSGSSYDYCPIKNDNKKPVDMTLSEYMKHEEKTFYPVKMESIECDKITRDYVKKKLRG